MLYIFKSKKVIAWIIIIAITLAFIFGQSTLSLSESLDKSTSVLHFFENLFKPKTESSDSNKEDSQDNSDINDSVNGNEGNNESIDDSSKDEADDGAFGDSQDNTNNDGSDIHDSPENDGISEDKDGGQSNPETKKPRPFAQFLKKNFRKVAHFIEHGVLGFEVFFLAFIIEKLRGKRRVILPLNISTLLLILNIGFIVAFFDESIQIFSGRGPSVKDMWIDIAGYTSFLAVCFIITLIVKLIAFIFKNRKCKPNLA